MDKDLLQFTVLLFASATLITIALGVAFLNSASKYYSQLAKLYKTNMITNDEDLFDAFERLASSEVPTLRTLKEAGADRLDFHEVHVRSLQSLLKKAFDLGFKHRDRGGFN